MDKICIKYIVLAFFLTLLSPSFLFSSEALNPNDLETVNVVSNPHFRRRRRHFQFGRPFIGFGFTVGVGASKSVGSVNYETLLGLNPPDTLHDDKKKHLDSYSFGVKFEYTLFGFMWIGYTVSILYQTYGLKINNEIGLSGGTPYTGNTHSLRLSYIIVNPTFKMAFTSVGIYFGFLTKAKLSDASVFDKFKKIDFGFTYAIDLTLPAFKKFGMSFVFEGIFGIINLYKDSSRTFRNIGFNFKFSFLYNFNN